MSNKKKGFIIFVVVGIIGLVGMMMLSIHWYSQQRNVQSHRTYYNEQARIVAESGLQLLLSAIREGAETPENHTYNQILQAGPSQMAKNGFFAFFLRHLKNLGDFKAGNISSGIIENAQIINLLPPKSKNALNNFLKNYPDVEISFKMEYIAKDLYSDIEEEPRIKDLVEKKINLRLLCSATIRGVTKLASISKKLLVYSLLPTLTSRFSFYHKTDIGDSYNKLITHRNGRPPQWPDKSFKNDLNFPLFIFNGPREEEKIKNDKNLLRAQGSGPNRFDHLYSSSELDKSKAEILRRGYLYFGSNPGNTLRLTPGAGDEDGYSQYFMLFNINLDNGLTSYWATQNRQPEFLNSTHEISNWHPGEIPEYQITQGRAYIMSFADGFYETLPTTLPQEDPDYYLKGYDASSALIHPFGSRKNPSRAYTVGAAALEYIQLKTLAADRKYDNSDESAQEICNSGRPVPKHDAYLDMLKEMTEYEWPGIFAYNWNKSGNTEAYVQNCDGEPARITMPDNYTPENVFPDYESYKPYMSEITRVPLNNMIDYPHFTHETIPPHGHADFEKYMFAPDNPEELFRDTEKWPFEKSLLHPADALYFDGSVYDMNPDLWDGIKDFYSMNDMEELEKRGYLIKGAQKYYLNTNGHRIGVNGGINLEFPLEVTGHSSLIINGDCRLSGVSAQNVLFAIRCNNIIFSTAKFMKDPEEIFDGLYSAKYNAGKDRPDLKLFIFGGLAVNRLSETIFQSPTAVNYDPFYKPTGEQADFFYRIVMDEKRLPEKVGL